MKFIHLRVHTVLLLDHPATEQQQTVALRQVLPHRLGRQRAGSGHLLSQPADQDGGGRDQQVPAGPQGVHQGAGPQGGPPPLQGQQAHTGPQGLLHRGEGQDLHGEFNLFFIFICELALKQCCGAEII